MGGRVATRFPFYRPHAYGDRVEDIAVFQVQTDETTPRRLAQYSLAVFPVAHYHRTRRHRRGARRRRCKGLSRSPAPTLVRHASVGRPGAYCHIVWKPNRLKGATRSDGAGVQRCRVIPCATATPSARTCWDKAISTRVFGIAPLAKVTETCVELAGFHNKVFRSDTLTESDISNPLFRKS